MGFYTESAKQLINPVSIPDFLMECAHIDRVLFEGMIELDFAEIYNESGNIVLTEEEQQAGETAAKDAEKKAGENIFKKFLEALKGIFSKIGDALNKFFSETTSLVSSKVINDPKAKECQTEDIWYGDYVTRTKPFLDLSAYDKFLNVVKNLYTNIIKGNYEDTDLNSLNKESLIMAAELNRFLNFPTTVEENNNAPDNSKINPVKLGTKAGEFKDLQKDLSPAGIATAVKSIFSKLSTPDEYVIKIDKDSETKKIDQRIVRQFKSAIFGAKLTLMTFTGKAVSNSLKIARRNYKEIAAAVKGKEVNASEKETNEAVFVAAQFSDLFCESVFEF